MDRAYLEIIFLCGMVFQAIMVLPYLPDYYTSKKHFDYFNKKERLYLLFAGFGYLLLPLMYIFSTWFSWFDYNLSKWLTIPALLLYGFGFWLFFKAYTILGSSWSIGLKIKEGNILVTSGPYKWVRHPVYAAFAAIGLAQILMLQNWMVGPAFLILGIPLYRYRVGREEQQLIIGFGEQYLSYMKRTNALIPKIEEFDFSAIQLRLQVIWNRFKMVIRRKRG